MATFIKRKNDTWQAKIRHKGQPPQSKTFNSKAAAQRWEKLIELEMENGTFVSRAESELATLHEALQRYLKKITPHKKGAEKEAHKIKAWMARPFSKHFLLGIRGSHLATFHVECLAEGKRPSTIYRTPTKLIDCIFIFPGALAYCASR